MKFFIKTFGCSANASDSKRVENFYRNRGLRKTKNAENADVVIINTCMVRQSAEDRIYGLVRNLGKQKEKPKIILTGCIVGMMLRDKTGKMITQLKKKLPEVDEFLSIEELGNKTVTGMSSKTQALVSISNGCDNFCSFCVVPYARGKEKSRPFDNIVSECKSLAKKGIGDITLIGQNVNSYGSDIVKSKTYKIKNKTITPIVVKHLGKYRIPTLFPQLLEEIAKIEGIKKISFISSNPWDFSEELIEVILENPKVSRQIHLPVQSGDDEILKKMNRWYTGNEYIELIRKIKKRIPSATFSTDIIVGFPSETEKEFQSTVDLCKKVGFEKAYVSEYSDRPMTIAHKNFKDDVPKTEKKRRWQILEDLINKPHLKWKNS